jgi:hypothetical protein
VVLGSYVPVGVTYCTYLFRMVRDILSLVC